MSWFLLGGLLLLGDRLDLSAPGGDHPLRPPTRHRLGGPLPHQLPDRPRALPRAVGVLPLPFTPPDVDLGGTIGD